MNLNRNFDYNRGASGSGDPLDPRDYRGPTPASEPETQYAQALIDTLANEAAVIVDCHNHISLDTNGYVMWTGSDDPESRRILANVSREMHGWLYRELPHLTDQSLGLNRITKCLAGSLEGYAGSVGGRGALFESVTGVGSTRADVMRANTETLVRLLDAFVRFDVINNTLGDIQ